MQERNGSKRIQRVSECASRRRFNPAWGVLASARAVSCAAPWGPRATGCGIRGALKIAADVAGMDRRAPGLNPGFPPHPTGRTRGLGPSTRCEQPPRYWGLRGPGRIDARWRGAGAQWRWEGLGPAVPFKPLSWTSEAFTRRRSIFSFFPRHLARPLLGSPAVAAALPMLLLVLVRTMALFPWTNPSPPPLSSTSSSSQADSYERRDGQSWRCPYP